MWVCSLSRFLNADGVAIQSTANGPRADYSDICGYLQVNRKGLLLDDICTSKRRFLCSKQVPLTTSTTTITPSMTTTTVMPSTTTVRTTTMPTEMDATAQQTSTQKSTTHRSTGHQQAKPVATGVTCPVCECTCPPSTTTGKNKTEKPAMSRAPSISDRVFVDGLSWLANHT